jgi:hypothetical protein
MRQFSRRVGLGVLLVAMFVSGWGWVRLLLLTGEMDARRIAIARHERMLMQHIGALVNHEQRIQALEQAIGGGRMLPEGVRPTFGDLVCSDASKMRRPLLGSER